ncbi:MAG: tetratricopeptide repeat protein [Candidatus Kariarchaeaceae archaeon]|jgi:tetratricopeptide (TPR) repeat protein
MTSQEKLIEAKEQYLQDSTTYNLIWYARRVAYVGEYEKAIELLTEEIIKFPQDPRLYRHRGHRYISVREFDKAISDLEKAVSLISDMDDELEEDGMPNSKNKPRSTLFFNIYYHLGLAYYLLDRFEQALDTFTKCRNVSKNDDSIVASTYWIYLTLFQLKASEYKTITDQIIKDMDIIENFAYHKLLLLYKDEITVIELNDEFQSDLDNSTISYGLAMWYLIKNQNIEANSLLSKIIKTGLKAAFGYIAAEKEIERIN